MSKLYSVSPDFDRGPLSLSTTSIQVFDFDKTLYRGDSSVDFIKWSLKRHPELKKGWYWKTLKARMAYQFGRKPKTHFKETGFSFLAQLEDPLAEVEAFWLERTEGFVPTAGEILSGERAAAGAFKPAAIARTRPGDVLASASPRFLVAPIAQHLGMHLIATETRFQDGIFESPNCYGLGKLQRIQEDLLAVNPGLTISDFYSDSISDEPCAALAQQAWFMEGERLVPWDQHKVSSWGRFKHRLMNPDDPSRQVPGK